MNHATAAEVIARHAPSVLALPGVAGIWEGTGPDGSACLVVALVEEDPSARARIPAVLEGYPVRVEITGRIGPQTG